MQVEICAENHQKENKYICPNDISNKLDEAIEGIIEKTGFTKCKIDKKSVCTNGGNYLGLLYEIDLKGKTREGDKELNIFVKSVIPGENNMEIISISDAYKTELFTYKELSKIFEELQEEARVPVEERFKMVKCYNESSDEVIILENLSKKGFNTGHRMDVVSLKFAKMAIAELAKFHSLTFVTKVKRREFFEKEIKTKKSSYIAGKQWSGFVQSMIQIPMDNIDEDVKERVEKVCQGLAERFLKNYNDDASKRCLCHGDYRPNNILTKMIDQEEAEIVAVDYQLMYFGCPISDILYFIINSTDREFRRAHLSDLRDLYHDTMTKFLKHFDIDVNSFYSREEFEKEYNKKLEYGLMHALIFLPFMFVSEDDVPDLTKRDMSTLSFKVHDKYKDRIQGIVDDYIEWGVI